ncbi:hypothetical protein Ciccas_008135 [Cichlidogyrus casuarinus]|uniref:B30.2/SPRY domain-containing protein n=1 Tax=Cichlidogyrus casuarinus TaxID=1844966 RepID=A0ABD2Q0U1_9PLAT
MSEDVIEDEHIGEKTSKMKKEEEIGPSNLESTGLQVETEAQESIKTESRLLVGPIINTDCSDVMEEKPEWELDSSVFLDPYNSDLNLNIHEDYLHAEPLTEGGFALMWSGVRANYGLLKGKTFFECKVLENLRISPCIKENSEQNHDHVLRLGWSLESTDFALGDSKYSYGFGGTGKKSTQGLFSEYGRPFNTGDVVTAFLDYDGQNASILFSLNGDHLGEAFKISDLDHKPLFPHIYCKNVSFRVNFGSTEFYFPPMNDIDSWIPFNNVPIDYREHGKKPPTSFADCEMVMLIGLPGAGKSYLANKMVEEHRDKRYNVLGTNLILEKMKVTGLSRKRNYAGRWESLIEKATHCLNTLLQVACKRRRNYILDQTNVYPSAQRRKIAQFREFKCRAIVIVPDEETLNARYNKAQEEEGKEVNQDTYDNMKANFSIPRPKSIDSSSFFDSIEFAELQEAEARRLVEGYNKEIHIEVQNNNKRPRHNQSNGNRWNGPGYRNPGMYVGPNPTSLAYYQQRMRYPPAHTGYRNPYPPGPQRAYHPQHSHQYPMQHYPPQYQQQMGYQYTSPHVYPPPPPPPPHTGYPEASVSYATEEYQQEVPSASQMDPAAAAVAAYASYYAAQGIPGSQAGKAAAGTEQKLSIEEATKQAAEYNAMQASLSQSYRQTQPSSQAQSYAPSAAYYPRVGHP